MTEIPQRWALEIELEKTAYHTRAHALLRTGDGEKFAGIGLAHRPLEGHGLAHVADYLAVGRALSDLTQELLEAVATDIDVEVSRVPEEPAIVTRIRPA